MELLDQKELVKRFHGFFEEYMRKEIRKALHEGHPSIAVDFFAISEYDIELGDQLLTYPKDVLEWMEETLRQYYDEESGKPLKVRLLSLPGTEKMLIREIRSEHLGKLVLLEGLVRRKTDVRPRLISLEYLCSNPSCNHSQERISVQQTEEKVKTLKACPKCKSGVELVHRNLVDSQSLVLEEHPEQLENQGDQPKRLNILLQGDLVRPFKDGRTNPGSRVYIIGTVKELPRPTKTGAESVDYELLIEGNNIELSEEDYRDIVISKEEEEHIKDIASRDEAVDIFIKNMAPSIYGHERIKESIILQVFGGSGATKGDGTTVRGDIHVLLVGDPGAAKSQLLKSATRIAPKSMVVSGKSASAAGITASVVKDELTRGWALEAGAIVLASGGLCAIDELDKMTDEDRSALHEAMEQQTISIAKANIRATLQCKTTLLGAANPKLGRFDPYGDIARQINLPPALMSRFDLIFVLRDIPDQKRDDLIADHILQTHKDKSKTTTELSSDFMKKYIAYAKMHSKPVLTKEAIEKLKSFYVKMRNASADDENHAMPITARQLEAIVRLSEAYAKMRLKKRVSEQDAENAINLMMYCLEKIGVDPKTGEMDIDRITTGVTASTRNQYKSVQQIIDKIEAEHPEITHELIMEEAEKQKISSTDVEQMLEKLKQEGIIFEPRKNIYKKLL